MSDIIGISSGAISAYQRALSTTSNNIANVNTQGYSRQVTVLEDSAPKQAAGMYMGTGVLVNSIKRQYDAFAESNLRNSTSDLSAQSPMVDYTSRVVDIMGNQTSGLSSALDSYFSAADALAADPASSTQRTSFLNSASGVASRFAEVSSQLDQVTTETTNATKGVADQINALTTQLAQINQSMTRSPTLEGQPAQLLDARDSALRDLSALVKIKVSYSTNGMATVSLSTSGNRGLVVDGIKSKPLNVDFSQGKIEFIIDKYGVNTETVPDVSGGSLGGYQTFISQVLNPAVEQLNNLANTFVNETNAIQVNGLDGYGNVGQKLFTISPSATEPAAGIQVALSDGMRVATAAQFRVSEGGSNVTTTKASVKYSGTTPSVALSNPQIVNNPNVSAGVTFKVEGAKVYTPVTSVSAGVSSVFYLDNAAPGQQLQVLTKDGQQIMGKSLTETQKYQMLTADNGFSSNINYSDQYLNQTGAAAYRGLDYFYGAKADVLNKQNYDAYGNVASTSQLAATLMSSRLTSLSGIGEGNLTVNNVALGAYSPTGKTGVTISGVNQGSSTNGTFTGFSFSIKLGDKNLQIPANLLSGASDMVGLKNALQSALQTADGSGNLNVELINNGSDLKIEDSAKRTISSAGFSLSGTASDASAGEVSLNTDATRVVDWFNGVSKATVDGINFGTEVGNSSVSGHFSSFSMTLGNVDYNIAMPDIGAPTSVPDLAKYLQNQLRELDKSNNISVTTANGQLTLVDRAGRSMGPIKLSPSATTEKAFEGTQTLSQSNVSQSKVRATLVSQVSAPASTLNFKKSLSINGVSINGYYKQVDGANQWISGYSNTNDLIQAINQSGAGVSAALSDAGDLVISNQLGAPITIDPSSSGNALNIDAGTYQPQLATNQVMRDLAVSSANLDFTKALTLNGVNITPGVASYTLPASDQQSNTSISWMNNSSTMGVTLTGVTQGEAANFSGFSFSMKVGNTTLNVPSTDLEGCTNLSELAVSLQRSLQSKDGSGDLHVAIVNNGKDLQITDGQGRAVTNAAFSLTGGATSASTGTMLTSAQELAQQLNADASFSPNYLASVNPDGTLHLALKVGATPSTISIGTTTHDFSSSATYDYTMPTSAGKVTSVSWSYQVTPNANDDTAHGLVDKLNTDPAFSAGGFKAIISSSGKLLIESTNGTLSDDSLASRFNLSMGGVLLSHDPAVTTRDGLVQRIKDLSSESGVTASVDSNGDVIMSTTDLNGVGALSIGPNKNADGTFSNTLGVSPGNYDVSARISADLKKSPQDKDIRLGFGSNGQPSDLSSIGMRTAAYMQGGSPDDLLVFVTGKGAASVAADFSGAPVDQQQSLRSQSLTVKFTASDRYNIIDNKTGTVLADRKLDTSSVNPVIEFDGLKLQLTSTPVAGDSYVIDGNSDGLGNNVNMLEMSSLSTKKVSDGKTLSELYINQVNDVGNLGQQAKVSQAALQAVKDQASASRDKVSGVSLDDEAADLIRYQQAYQAAAKALQVATELFDSIKQIN